MSQPPHPPRLDPEQFVGGTPAGDDDPHAFASNDQSDPDHTQPPEETEETEETAETGQSAPRDPEPEEGP
jgi:hypothetical protein